MADFTKPYLRTLGFEGITLENNTDDPGGLTFCGIARNENPTWAGWPFIDRYVVQANNVLSVAKNLCLADIVLMDLMQTFYQKYEWNAHLLGQFNYQELAVQVYDAVVNIGDRAIEALQKLVNVTQDGCIGPVSLTAINNVVDQSGLVDNYISWRKSYYEALAVENPTDYAEDLVGWLKRCARSDV